MSIFQKTIILLFSVLTLSFAEEGMWMLSQLDELDLKEKGMELELKEIFDSENPALVQAMVWLGGCSASFVSSDGLVLTNHHCAYGALQRASAAASDVDYITDGFLASKKGDELKALNQNAMILEEMKEVTSEVLDYVKDIKDPAEKSKKIAEKIAMMKKEIEGDKDDVLVKIAGMYKGKEYYLYKYKKYQDVRIVYAPPRSIGNYGDEIDNWMWPRHTGDFTYLRVYMAPDGSGAKYSPDNIPVQPKKWLKISTSDLKENDFTFIMGHPGRTSRWRTSISVDYSLNTFYPERNKTYTEMANIIDDLTKDSDEGRIKMASLKARLENTLKNYQGKMDGMHKTNFLGQKQDFEKELLEYIQANDQLKMKYASIITEIKNQYDDLAKTKVEDDALGYFGFTAGTMTRVASSIYNTVKELEKPLEDRKPGLDEKSVAKTAAKLKYSYLGFYEEVDKAFFVRVLNKLKAIPEADQTKEIKTILEMASPDLDAYVDKMYANTKLKDAKFAASLFKKSSKELEALDDPFINIMQLIYVKNEEAKERKKTFNARVTDLRKKYMEALVAWKGDKIYPDANGTMRLTFGNVAGYCPTDAVDYKPFTTLSGVIDKNTGEIPFDMPPKLEELHNNRDFGKWMDPELLDVPVAFLHRCDITGGNSGSPVMNSKGELIGLAFDGNWEAMTGDWQYNYKMQRTISVDIRYVMWITEKFANADYLLEEMGLHQNL